MNTKQARGNFRDLLNRVAAGDEVVITRRGADIARVVPAKSPRRAALSSHKALRESIRLSGEPMSKTVIRLRREERF